MIVAGPFIFIEKEVVGGGVTLGGVIEPVEELVVVSKLVIDIGRNDFRVAVADAINPTHEHLLRSAGVGVPNVGSRN